MTYIT